MRRAVVLCSMLAGCQAGTPEPLDTAAIKTAIDDASLRLSRGFETGQLDSGATILTDDHHSMPPNYPAISGRSAWLESTRAMMVGGRWTSVTTAESRIYSDSLTVDRGRYVNTFVPAADAPSTLKAVSDTGKYLWIWRSTSSGWQLAQAMWNSNSSPKP